MGKTKEQSLTDEKLKADLERAVKKARAILKRYHVDRLKETPGPEPMSPKDILRLRKSFNFSQEVFARLLNVSPNTVQAWEQGTRVPSGAALKLLTIAERYPKVLLDVVSDSK